MARRIVGKYSPGAQAGETVIEAAPPPSGAGLKSGLLFALAFPFLFKAFSGGTAALFSGLLAGGLMLPESDGFGPCFTRTTGKVRRFELGFEPKSLVGDVKTIRDLQLGSEAAKAGLRGGDVVTYGQALDALQGDPEKQLTLQVTRGGKTFPISYLPRAEEVEIYQWKRVPGVPDKACGR